MSQENVESVRGAFERFVLLGSPQLDSMDPEVETYDRFHAPWAGMRASLWRSHSPSSEAARGRLTQ